MKRLLSLMLLICLCFTLVLSFTACDLLEGEANNNDETENKGNGNDTPAPNEHKHEASTTWTKDDTHHWHICTPDCTEKLDKAEHTWNDGAITTPATKDQSGVKEFTCTICGQTKTESVEFDVWASYFDYESIKNATVTSVQTDVTNDIVTNTNIKIDGDRWERLVADFSYNNQYYETCIVYFDGEKTYLDGEESDCPVFKDAFFSFIDFSTKGDLFTETEKGRYEIGENTYKLYGFTVSDVVIIIENDTVTSISMALSMGNTLLTLEYRFFDFGTTVIEGLTSGT